ncbi:NAD(P) transhydrogenase subunit alpha [Mycobacterium tuberculosis CAS/NITR204]|uniref:NAD(P) transhydrogenase subunit alpha n=1 Tax=Mycobacterium tuberculosis CAS/NITR204 TaxID=1310114 RepID=R4M1U9_MYCTX|nr:NAD(P) transhydrogenase subunit alpha [Mycobacterium tuberculosis CAS/NITR204]
MANPATVLVLGVGVAGLQALATAKRLGGAQVMCGHRGGRPSDRWALNGLIWASQRPVRAVTPAN